MQFSERTFKDVFGATVIQSRLQPAPDGRVSNADVPRYPSGGWPAGACSHSQGSGTGSEVPTPFAMRLKKVNQFQRLGIERYLRELVN